MSEPALDPAPLNQAMTRTHRSVLVLLAACGLFIVLQPGAAAQSPPPLFTGVAVGLAVGSILCRRLSVSPAMSPKPKVGLAVAGLVFAALVGVTAVALTQVEGDKQNALLFVLGAAILSLRPPIRIVPTAGA
ncbi:MAG: hypothetical protein JRG96_18905 [Deltaproteobacteria bacterium]|nr:hypothetical protein [Deltaproteobacteria bacterium]